MQGIRRGVCCGRRAGSGSLAAGGRLAGLGDVGRGAEPQTRVQASVRLLLVTAIAGSATYCGNSSPSMALIRVCACMAPWWSSNCAPPPISWLPVAMFRPNWVPRSWVVTGIVEPMPRREASACRPGPSHGVHRPWTSGLAVMKSPARCATSLGLVTPIVFSLMSGRFFFSHSCAPSSRWSAAHSTMSMSTMPTVPPSGMQSARIDMAVWPMPFWSIPLVAETSFGHSRPWGVSSSMTSLMPFC